jgi:hypothetical protein
VQNKSKIYFESGETPVLRAVQQRAIHAIGYHCGPANRLPACNVYGYHYFTYDL